MFSEFAIRATSLSKSYQLYDKPHDRLKQAIWRGKKQFYHDVSVLNNVSFEMKPGGTMGIIGRNGAGKSTLLQLICGTLNPSQGSIEVHGRVAALLELGAGFNPEFTGRENVYMNAAINGLSQAEIDAKFEEIADFADIGEYIEQPVKTYSSGMYVRLAFATATNIDPDILIIDEALSVGDQLFQKKCIDRMMRFREEGKTILFCSHSMYLVKELCDQTLWLNNGCMQAIGDSAEVISSYLSYLESEQTEPKPSPPSPSKIVQSNLPEVMIDSITMIDINGNILKKVDLFQTVIIRIRTKCLDSSIRGHLGIGITKPDGQLVFGTTTKEDGLDAINFEKEQIFELEIPSFPLVAGVVKLKGMVADEYSLRLIHEFTTDSYAISSKNPELGMLWIEHKWTFPVHSKNS